MAISVGFQNPSDKQPRELLDPVLPDVVAEALIEPSRNGTSRWLFVLRCSDHCGNVVLLVEKRPKSLTPNRSYIVEERKHLPRLTCFHRSPSCLYCGVDCCSFQLFHYSTVSSLLE